jgi:branched-chain amino acid transport system substrate-binding protein
MKIASAALLAAVLTAATGTASQADILIGMAAPLSGPQAWLGSADKKGLETAVADLNAKGGVLGQRVRFIVVDDFCDPDQAVAAAHKLVDAGVVFVAGNACSGAAIPASLVYAAAGILMIDGEATNPKLTEQGLASVFRITGRDDEQGSMAGDYLADHWAGKHIAIVHDGQVYGKGLAEEAKKRLNERGVTETMFEAITPGANHYSELAEKMKTAGIDVIYFGGYTAEGALIIREARDAGSNAQFVGGDGLSTTDDFGLITGPTAEGTLATNLPDLRKNPEVVAILKKHGVAYADWDSNVYAVIQVWAQAAEMTGTLQLNAMVSTLRSGKFDTLYGKIGFDKKGDLTGKAPFIWLIWKNGAWVPTDTATQ